MRFNFVNDLPQYQKVLIPLCRELTRRGHDIVWTNTRISTAQEMDGYMAVQDVAYRVPRPNKSPRFFINHGSSIIKDWDINFDIDYFLAPTKYWAESARAKQEANGNKYTISPPVGWPKIDSILELRDDIEERERIVSAFKLDKTQPIICFYPTYKKQRHDWSRLWERDYDIKTIVNILKTKTPNLFVLPHQMDDTGEFDNLDVRISRGYPDLNPRLFAMADIIVSDTSGAAFEACSIDTPVIMLNDINNPPTVSDNDKPVDFGPICDDTNLSHALDVFLSNPNWYGRERKHWREYMFGKCDGNDSKRIADYMESVL